MRGADPDLQALGFQRDPGDETLEPLALLDRRHARPSLREAGGLGDQRLDLMRLGNPLRKGAVELPLILEKGDEPFFDKALYVACRHAASGVGRLRSSSFDERVGDVITVPGHDAAGSGGRQGSRAQMLQRALDRPQGGAVRRRRNLVPSKAGIDPNRPFKTAVANVGYGIAKRSSNDRDRLGS